VEIDNKVLLSVDLYTSETDSLYSDAVWCSDWLC